MGMRGIFYHIVPHCNTVEGIVDFPWICVRRTDIPRAACNHGLRRSIGLWLVSKIFLVSEDSASDVECGDSWRGSSPGPFGSSGREWFVVG